VQPADGQEGRAARGSELEGLVSGQAVASVVGSTLPAVSVSYADNIYIVFMAECAELPYEAWPEGEPICAHCLLEECDAQVARGLDLAKVHGQVDWDAEAGEWFVPPDAPVHA
jgi:hypothetical protein